MTAGPEVLAYIGLGANLGDPPAQLEQACAELGCLSDTRAGACSRLYRSAPLGPADQPDYCNAVVAAHTGLSAQALMAALLQIEQRMGRSRSGPRWGPRTIDLDLLLYGDAVIDITGLTVPHPEMTRRNFVLQPLLEIAPGLEIPGQGSAAELLDALGGPVLPLWERGA